MPLSIRWRLTLWNVVALAVVRVGVGGLVYGMLAAALYAQLDRRLTLEREQLVGDERLPREPLPRFRHWIGEFEEDQNSFTVVYDDDGRPLLHSPRLAEANVPPAPDASEAPRFGSLKVRKLGRQRFERISAAVRRGEDLPAIDVYQVGEAYFVRDGHHRVAVYRALV